MRTHTEQILTLIRELHFRTQPHLDNHAQARSFSFRVRYDELTVSGAHPKLRGGGGRSAAPQTPQNRN
jgi:hypothetical protein